MDDAVQAGVTEEAEAKKTERRPKEPQASKKLRRKKYLFVYLMLLPAAINFAIFYLGINFNSFVMAFQKESAFTDTGVIYEFTLQNFRRLFLELKVASTDMHIGFMNTLKYFGSNLIITLPLSYLTAYFLYKKLWGYKFFRIIFFLPSIIPGLVYVRAFRATISVGGPLDSAWNAIFGSHIPALLYNADTATWTVVFFCIWTGFGVNLLLYQGAMGRIPEDVIEAGKLDGVGWVREMFQIVTPMIWPTLSTTIILALSKVFTASGPILLFNEAGSALSFKMDTISYFIFRQTYDATTSLNYPAAISVFFTVVSLPFVLLVRWLFGKIDPEVSY